jgi:hypothetical protein
MSYLKSYIFKILIITDIKDSFYKLIHSLLVSTQKGITFHFY